MLEILIRWKTAYMLVLLLSLPKINSARIHDGPTRHFRQKSQQSAPTSAPYASHGDVRDRRDAQRALYACVLLDGRNPRRRQNLAKCQERPFPFWDFCASGDIYITESPFWRGDWSPLWKKKASPLLFFARQSQKSLLIRKCTPDGLEIFRGRGHKKSLQIYIWKGDRNTLL